MRPTGQDIAWVTVGNKQATYFRGRLWVRPVMSEVELSIRKASTPKRLMELCDKA